MDDPESAVAEDNPKFATPELELPASGHFVIKEHNSHENRCSVEEHANPQREGGPGDEGRATAEDPEDEFHEAYEEVRYPGGKVGRRKPTLEHSQVSSEWGIPQVGDGQLASCTGIRNEHICGHHAYTNE